MLFFRRCFFRLEWGDGGGSSLGLELSTSAGPLAGEGRVGEVWEEERVGGRAVLPRAAKSSTLNCSWATLGEPDLQPSLPGEGSAQPWRRRRWRDERVETQAEHDEGQKETLASAAWKGGRRPRELTGS